MPDNVKAPLPCFKMATLAVLPSLMTPAKVVLVVVPVVKVLVPVPDVLLVIWQPVQVPEIESTVSSYPLRSNVPVPAPKSIADEFGITPAPPSCKVPAERVVVPV